MERYWYNEYPVYKPPFVMIFLACGVVCHVLPQPSHDHTGSFFLWTLLTSLSLPHISPWLPKFRKYPFSLTLEIFVSVEISNTCRWSQVNYMGGQRSLHHFFCRGRNRESLVRWNDAVRLCKSIKRRVGWRIWKHPSSHPADEVVQKRKERRVSKLRQIIHSLYWQPWKPLLLRWKQADGTACVGQ